MTVALFYDTETQGLPLFSEPSEHPGQPHIVQLAACLVDLTSRKTIAGMDVIVRPDGWTIPDQVAAIHGITTEHALDVGIPETQAVDMFMSLWRGRTRIAHNESFDARILRIALKRYVDPRDTNLAIPPSDDWKASRAECTQLLSTPILKLPPTAKMRAAGRNHHKSANLGEAYEFFTGKKLENAHSAMADVQGCMEVYFAIKGTPAQSAMEATR
ncbi:MAG: 3'-5' exonuclease [Diaphorobacter nitroreducens]|uniref:3'-5' exonuclease n=1 Tax=Diaphorobacter nitroreducens TaxID=164759 RepID=UPI003C7254F9